MYVGRIKHSMNRTCGEETRQFAETGGGYGRPNSLDKQVRYAYIESRRKIMRLIAVLAAGIFWVTAVALSAAVPVAIVWAAYHFITTYKG